MIVKNVGARIHKLSIMHEGRKQTVQLLPGRTLDVDQATHDALMACPSGPSGSGELVDWDRPMPRPAGLSLGGLDEDKALDTIAKCKDQEILLAWLKRESRASVKAAIDSRLRALVPPPPPPPATKEVWE